MVSYPSSYRNPFYLPITLQLQITFLQTSYFSPPRSVLETYSPPHLCPMRFFIVVPVLSCIAVTSQRLCFSFTWFSFTSFFIFTSLNMPEYIKLILSMSTDVLVHRPLNPVSCVYVQTWPGYLVSEYLINCLSQYMIKDKIFHMKYLTRDHIWYLNI